MALTQVGTLMQEAVQGMSVVRFIRWAEQLEGLGACIAGQVALPDGSGRTAHKFVLDPDRQIFIWRDERARYRLWQPVTAGQQTGR
jgi:hypothetical protein